MTADAPIQISIEISDATVRGFVSDNGLTNEEAINAIVVAGLVKRGDRRAAALLHVTLHRLESQLADQAVKP